MITNLNSSYGYFEMTINEIDNRRCTKSYILNLVSLCLQVVDVSFASFNIDNPPTCSIPWNYTYRYPTERSYSSLPGCFTKVVQPAFDFYVEHSFFFKIYDWKGHFETIIVPE